MMPNTPFNHAPLWKRIQVNAVAAADTPKPVFPTALELIEAAKRFEARTDSFAVGKGTICRDMASKLERFGSYASDKQQEFAGKLVAWSKPRPVPVAESGQPQQRAPEFRVPNLYPVMQKHSTFYADPLRIARKNQDQVCWILWNDILVGKIDNEVVTLWPGKAAKGGVDINEVRVRLEEFEENPLVAAMKYGKLAGRCCSCGRDLTDPVSIEAGIGPICAGRF